MTLIRRGRGLGDATDDETASGDDTPVELPSNIPTWVPSVYASLLKQAPDLAGNSSALAMALGWVSVESGGRYTDSDTSVFPQGENGLFQLSPDESASLGIDHGRLITDFDYSVYGGIQLIRKNMTSATGLGYDPSTDIFWHVVKWIHSTGLGGVKSILAAATADGVDTTDWDALFQYATDNRSALLSATKHDPVKWMTNVNNVFDRGLPLILVADLFASPAVSLPIVLALAGGLYWWATRG